jgi:hypothetical protein
MVNTPERVKITKKTTHAPSVVKRGRASQTKKDNASNKHPGKGKTRHLQKTVNVSQPVVDRHIVDIPQSTIEARYRNENASTSKNPDVLENHEKSMVIQEIFINYTSFKEVYDSSTIIINSCFSTIIAENLLADPDPNIKV